MMTMIMMTMVLSTTRCNAREDVLCVCVSWVTRMLKLGFFPPDDTTTVFDCSELNWNEELRKSNDLSRLRIQIDIKESGSSSQSWHR